MQQSRAASGRATVAGYIFGSRLLRGVFISMVLSGIGISITSPQMTLFLVNEVHLSVAAAGLFYLTNLAAPIAGYIVGTLSDRTGSRLRLFRITAVAGSVGWVLMAFATQTWMPFAVNIVLLSIAGAGAAQLQAAVRDELDREPTPLDNRVVAVMRMAMAIGWVVGPVIGAVLGAALGLRLLLIGTGLALLLSIVPLIGITVITPVRDVTATRAARSRRGRSRSAPNRSDSMVPLVLFTGIYVLVMCGETVKLAYLPLYLDGVLHVDAAVRGGIIGLQPLIEIMLMPVAAAIADRLGVATVLFAGAVMAVGAHVCYASADLFEPHLVPVVLGQVLMAGVIATFSVLGITVAQRLLPTRVGTASSVFLSSYALNGAIGGFLGSVGTAWLGLPHLFWISASVSAVGALSLILLNAFVPLSTTVRGDAVATGIPQPARDR
ncbi:MFS transporter [Plantibacter sp. YIM 135249]|uniref:MFS transporter n=1 Tax=Plantibacter sp. YIM 135249 TaxID=3423918 RepID=UPI003D334B25